MLQSRGRFEPNDDAAGFGQEEKGVASGSPVGVVSRPADDQRLGGAGVAVPDAADLVAGARPTSGDDALHVGLRLGGRRRRADAVSAERGQGELDSLSRLAGQPPAAVRLLTPDQRPRLAADVAAVTSHGRVPVLTTFGRRLVMSGTG